MDKIKLYEEGGYLMPVPPVITVSWTRDNWINFIDNNGKWIVK